MLQKYLSRPSAEVSAGPGFVMSDRYQRICQAARQIRCRSALIDGEMIVQGENEVSDFHALRSDIARGGHRLVLYGFDLLHLDADDLRSAPLVERRSLLCSLIQSDASSPIQFSESFEGSGAELFAAADAMGLEGIVSKRMTSRYQSGRSTAWLNEMLHNQRVRGDRHRPGAERTACSAVGQRT